MPHPITFPDHDFGHTQLRGLALGCAAALEKAPWGRPVSCAPKKLRTRLDGR